MNVNTVTSLNLSERIENILRQPLVHPAYDIHEALFHGNVRAKLLRAKLTKSGNGTDQIVIEGVVTSTITSPTKKTAENPSGWDAIAFGETVDAEGMRPMLGPTDVAGYRFVYAGSLSEGIGAEMLVNNLRLLGWKPERVKGLSGTSLTDFIPEDGADYVSAESLGMTDEVLVAVQLKEATENFGARLQIKGFKLVDVRVAKKEAVTLDSRFSDLLNRSLHGRLDSRKDKEREQTAAKTGGRGKAASGGAATAGATKPALAAPAATTDVSDDDVPF
ncbi:hypothetical protein K0U83_17300 [bacterium]|nr:hypothetical protein [bacterium]